MEQVCIQSYWREAGRAAERCQRNSESRVSLHCNVARSMWWKNWSFLARSNSILLEDWLGFGRNKKAQTICSAMVLASLWVVWLELNRRIFEDKDMVFEDLFEKAKFLASLWASTYPSFKLFPLSLILLSWDDVLRKISLLFALVVLS